MLRHELRQRLSSKNRGAAMIDLDNDIERALVRYPALVKTLVKGETYVYGSFDAYDSATDTFIESHQILIAFPEDYPYRFPKVWEVTGKIPQIADRHVFSSGNLCFGNKLDEAMVCSRGINLIWFLENVLNPHLCREYVREHRGDYPDGERSHDTEGLWEGFYELFKSQDKQSILEALRTILYGSKLERNTPCFCRSGRKFKHCHNSQAKVILGIKRKTAVALYETLKNDYDK